MGPCMARVRVPVVPTALALAALALGAVIVAGQS
jgi:hypothetical protein